MAVVDCWFDYSSPFAYLGTTQIERVATEADATVRFRPFLLGALFSAVGTPMIPLHSFPPPKRRHQELDLERWADFWGVPFRFTSTFPLRTVTPLRVTLLADCAPALVHRVMRAAWVDDEDVASPEVLARCLADVGLPVELVDRAGDARDALRAATDEAIAIGCPGAPSFVVGDQLYWGQDRLPFVKAALEGRPPGVAR
ncbi:MAG: 2-hydroxychromene-2-carboxylate isomerase [Sandaracinaceae bacterium]|nr:2-hydroxychromene-2-carboxylate isomerase [Sandaracinaceae bacterium]